MKLGLTVLVFMATLFWAPAQWQRVHFQDKGEKASWVDTPERFLSPRSLKRRADQNIPLRIADVPVSDRYLDRLKAAGVKIHMTSRWFNYALTWGPLPPVVEQWPEVEKVEEVRNGVMAAAGRQAVAGSLNYGAARNQIEMLKGEQLHQDDFTGQGMLIAVLDGGFAGADTIAALDSLWLNGRIKGTYSFVFKDTNVFQSGTHGTSVLSVMGANVPGLIVGTAPDASYLLLNSEDQRSETPLEMDNWLAAAEYADSAGADVINSSLGYSEFDDPDDSFTYADMDGQTTLVTRAADAAGARGMAVVVSAGNSGSSPWRHISAPADGDSVLAVGAVDNEMDYASFSSHGPSADGRVKPDVAAQGAITAVVNGAGSLQGAFGTSFSAPIVAGLTACYWQEFPQLSAAEVLQNIRRSGDQYFRPDSLKGYGVPDFSQARVLSQTDWTSLEDFEVEVYPLPFDRYLYLQTKGIETAAELRVSIQDLRGRQLCQHYFTVPESGVFRLSPDLAPGSYLLRISSSRGQVTQKIFR